MSTMSRSSSTIAAVPTRRRLAFFRSALALWALGMVGVAVGASADPEISLSLVGVGDGVVEQGEPLRISVRLAAPRDFDGTIELAPVSASWSEAVVVELFRTDGGLAVVRAEGVGKPAASGALLDRERMAGGLWTISSAAMQRVPPGDYFVRAHVSISSGRGWRGRAESDETPIGVAAVSRSVYRVAQRTVASRNPDATSTPAVACSITSTRPRGG